MHFTATASTDIGITKATNQDSLLIKHASTQAGEVLMAIVCDGMGGLAKGEVASATVIRAFDAWFSSRLPAYLPSKNLRAIGNEWVAMLKSLNQKIQCYGAGLGIRLGTTFSGILFLNGSYVIVHVGDTRIYRLDNHLTQLTEDQTFIAREIRLGHMTPEQAQQDHRRNMLLQCIGASPSVEPQVLLGNTQPGVYMLCTDGFRHKITPQEIHQILNPSAIPTKDAMFANAQYLINMVKYRQESDNISVILVRADNTGRE